MDVVLGLLEQLTNNTSEDNFYTASSRLTIEAPLKFTAAATSWNSNRRLRYKQRMLKKEGKAVTLHTFVNALRKNESITHVVCRGGSFLKYLSPMESSLLFQGLGQVSTLVSLNLCSHKPHLSTTKDRTLVLTLRALELTLKGAQNLEELVLGKYLTLCGGNCGDIKAMAAALSTNKKLRMFHWAAKFVLVTFTIFDVLLDPIVQTLLKLDSLEAVTFNFAMFKEPSPFKPISVNLLTQLCCKITKLGWISNFSDHFMLLQDATMDLHCSLKELYADSTRVCDHVLPFVFADTVVNCHRLEQLTWKDFGLCYDTKAVEELECALSTRLDIEITLEIAVPSDYDKIQVKEENLKILTGIMKNKPNILISIVPNENAMPEVEYLDNSSALQTFCDFEFAWCMRKYEFRIKSQQQSSSRTMNDQYSILKWIDSIVAIQNHDGVVGVPDSVLLSCVYYLTLRNPFLFAASNISSVH